MTFVLRSKMPFPSWQDAWNKFWEAEGHRYKSKLNEPLAEAIQQAHLELAQIHTAIYSKCEDGCPTMAAIHGLEAQMREYDIAPLIDFRSQKK